MDHRTSFDNFIPVYARNIGLFTDVFSYVGGGGGGILGYLNAYNT